MKVDVIYPEVPKPLFSSTANIIGLRCFVCSAGVARPFKGRFYTCVGRQCPVRHRGMCQKCEYVWSGYGHHFCLACGRDRMLVDTGDFDASETTAVQSFAPMLSKIRYVAPASLSAVRKCGSCGMNYKSPKTAEEFHRQPYQWMRCAAQNCRVIGAICKDCIALGFAATETAMLGGDERETLRAVHSGGDSFVSMACKACRESSLESSTGGCLWQKLSTKRVLELARTGIPAYDRVLAPVSLAATRTAETVRLNQSRISMIIA